VQVRVPAKVNLHLGVGPCRPDGYHELETVFHAVSLFDDLAAEHDPDGGGLTLAITGEGEAELPTGDENLAIRAALALAEHAGVEPVARLRLRKGIPVAGGMAGGSADAAAALVACDALWGTALPREELHALAASLGSDVPFALAGGTALGTGRGEVLTPVLAPLRWHWVIAVAEGGLSTPAVYSELDRLRGAGGVPPIGEPDGLVSALRSADPAELGAVLANDLQPAALSLRPALRRTLDAGLDEGALAGLVSGSGPTCFFLAADADHAVRVAAALAGRGVCRTVRAAHGPVPGARVVTGREAE
jgi:4-diphosphocytidyl-2-C-methyl-D-erythritol kinase